MNIRDMDPDRLLHEIRELTARALPTMKDPLVFAEAVTYRAIRVQRLFDALDSHCSSGILPGAWAGVDERADYP